MSQRLVILISILILALAGAGTWWYFNQDQVSSILNRSDVNANTNTTSNSNSIPVNSNLPNEQKGTAEIDYAATINSVELKFSSASKLESFAGQPAETGQVFVIVYFDAVPSDQVLSVQSGLTNQATINYTGGSSPMMSLKVASDLVTGDRGYVKFSVPADAAQLKFRVGGDGAPQADLPL